jgi:hypothetical protein
MTGRATAILFTRFGLGHASEELQLRLIRSFLTVLRDLPEPPAALLFYTDGVKLACDGSPVLDELRHFAEHGASIVLCGHLRRLLRTARSGARRHGGRYGGDHRGHGPGRQGDHTLTVPGTSTMTSIDDAGRDRVARRIS